MTDKSTTRHAPATGAVRSDAERAFAELLNEAAPVYQPIDRCMWLYQGTLQEGQSFDGPTSAKRRAEILFDWLGGRRSFFVNKSNTEHVCLVNEGRVYRIERSKEFEALLYRLVNTTFEEKPGKIIAATLSALAHNEGRWIDVGCWFHLEDDGTILIHTSRRDDALIRITPGEVAQVPNGRSCLLRPSGKMHGIDYRPNVVSRDAFRDLKLLFLDNLPCAPENRYFVLCWTLYIWLLGLSRERPLLHLSGDSSSGKTTVANLIGALIYGDDQVTSTSVAAAWSDGAENPLILLDNIENSDLTKELKNFLLLASTGAERRKRSQNTNTGTVAERLFTQVLITSIEPLHLPELINRTWDVQCDKQWWREGFNKIETLQALKDRRDDILSAWFQAIARKVLPTWNERKKHYLDYLRMKHPSHSKDRAKEFFAGMLVILENVIESMPDGDISGQNPQEKIANLISKMFDTQKGVSEETEIFTNPIYQYLESLKDVSLYAENRFKFESEYRVKVVSDPPEHSDDRVDLKKLRKFGFKGTPGQFHSAFGYLANSVLKSGWPYNNIYQFSMRLRDSLKVLEKTGWKITETTNRGQKYYTFWLNLDDLRKADAEAAVLSHGEPGEAPPTPAQGSFA